MSLIVGHLTGVCVTDILADNVKGYSGKSAILLLSLKSKGYVMVDSRQHLSNCFVLGEIFSRHTHLKAVESVIHSPDRLHWHFTAVINFTNRRMRGTQTPLISLGEQSTQFKPWLLRTSAFLHCTSNQSSFSPSYSHPKFR